MKQTSHKRANPVKVLLNKVPYSVIQTENKNVGCHSQKEREMRILFNVQNFSFKMERTVEIDEQ